MSDDNRFHDDRHGVSRLDRIAELLLQALDRAEPENDTEPSDSGDAKGAA